MAAANFMMKDTSFWLNKRQVEDAECAYYAKLSGASPAVESGAAPTQSSLANEIAKAREQIKQSLKASDAAAVGGDNANLITRLIQVEEENKELRKVTTDLQAAIKGLEARIKSLEVSGGSAPQTSVKLSPAPPKESSKDDADDDDDDDDFDLFGSDDEDEEEKEEAEKIKQERLAAYAEKKAKKPKVIAKSNVILDVKPWDDETDMAEMEKMCRQIEMEGLLWGASKLVPVGYGIKKLQIATVIVDDLVSVEELTEKIEAFEDFVQSVDIAAFNKI